MLLCFGLAWIITNGWSYILLGLGTYFQIGWMIAIAGTYLAFLWLPITVEKPITIAIAILLLRFLFPNDEKTLAVLKNMLEKIKENTKSKKKNKKKKKKKHLDSDDSVSDDGDDESEEDENNNDIDD